MSDVHNFETGDKYEWDSYEDFLSWQKTGKPEPRINLSSKESMSDYVVARIDKNNKSLTVEGLNEETDKLRHAMLEKLTEETNGL